MESQFSAAASFILLARAKTENLPKREFKAKTEKTPKREFKPKTGKIGKREFSLKFKTGIYGIREFKAKTGILGEMEFSHSKVLMRPDCHACSCIALARCGFLLSRACSCAAAFI